MLFAALDWTEWLGSIGDAAQILEGAALIVALIVTYRGRSSIKDFFAALAHEPADRQRSHAAGGALTLKMVEDLVDSGSSSAPAPAIAFLKQELVSRSAILDEEDYDSRLRLTLNLHPFLRNASPELWDEVAKTVVADFNSAEIEFVAILNFPRASQKTSYDELAKAITARLTGLNKVAKPTQVMPSHCDGSTPIPAALLQAKGRNVLVINLLGLDDGYVETALKYLEDKVRAVPKGVATVFGSDPSMEAVEQKTSVTSMPRKTVFALDLKPIASAKDGG